MDLEKLKGRMISFWTLHVSGWLVFAASTVIFAYTGNWTDVPHLLRYLAPYLVGFLSCLPLRYFYKAVRLHERPWPQSFLGGLAASFIGVNLWLGIDLAISRRRRRASLGRRRRPLHSAVVERWRLCCVEMAQAIYMPSISVTGASSV